MAISARTPEDVLREATKVLQRGGQRFVRTMVTQRLSGPTSANSLSRRSGNLARSVGAEVRMVGPMTLRLVGFVRSTAPYARIHEYGGVIKPKKAKFLAIPLQKTRGGAASFASAMGPRNYPGKLTFVVSKKGNLLLGLVLYKGGKQKGFKPLYVLKRSVYIPPRLGLRATFMDEVRETWRELRSTLGKIKVTGKTKGRRR